MDPEARRFIWSLIEKLSLEKKQSAVLLTSHSMEEAEALSTKMGIMARGGVLQCIGSSQHIKDRFAAGYEVELKVRQLAYGQLQEFATNIHLNCQRDQKLGIQGAKTLLKTSGLPSIVAD